MHWQIGSKLAEGYMKIAGGTLDATNGTSHTWVAILALEA